MRKLTTQGKFSLLSRELVGKRISCPAPLLSQAWMPWRPRGTHPKCCNRGRRCLSRVPTSSRHFPLFLYSSLLLPSTPFPDSRKPRAECCQVGPLNLQAGPRGREQGSGVREQLAY